MSSSKVSWSIMTVLALFVAVYAGFLIFMPGSGPPFVGERRVDMPLALYAHLAGGLVAIAIGPWQLSTKLRARALHRHRWMGRVYVIAVLVGGLGGLSLATKSMFGLVTHVGFGMLAVLWLFSTAMAWIRIREHDQPAHWRWMVRSYALTLAAVMLRLYIPLSAVLQIPFEQAYQAISWFCWVPNLIVAEWVILRRPAPEILPVA
jgi:uncharacterized membrane protein